VLALAMLPEANTSKLPTATTAIDRAILLFIITFPPGLNGPNGLMGTRSAGNTPADHRLEQISNPYVPNSMLAISPSID
jgi:hypothetical protein